MKEKVMSVQMKEQRAKEQVVDGLDRVAMTMKKGEVAELTIAPEYGFGSSESKQELAVVPPNSKLYYEVELESFVKERESWDMNTPKKIEAAGRKKEEGNVLELASTNVKALYIRAQAYIQLADLDLAEIDIKKALEIDPKNSIYPQKAKHRADRQRAQALMMRCDGQPCVRVQSDALRLTS
ncbi:hypothetical protein IFM89_026824 [Coptis chinensis]|uniref:peptidylprolyl isomerase n=1 Tax=Coptis chinensis TaxID=261450 RepID=A0A835M1U3_9MAGN|nr:hypothetical protein IFM89_026824 [Coptis chinensis]